MNRKSDQQGTPNRLPGEAEYDGIPDDQQEVKEPRRQTHESKDNPRDDHASDSRDRASDSRDRASDRGRDDDRGQEHLGYNRTHRDDNPGPVVEGSEKI